MLVLFSLQDLYTVYLPDDDGYNVICFEGTFCCVLPPEPFGP